MNQSRYEKLLGALEHIRVLARVKEEDTAHHHFELLTEALKWAFEAGTALRVLCYARGDAQKIDTALDWVEENLL